MSGGAGPDDQDARPRVDLKKIRAIAALDCRYVLLGEVIGRHELVVRKAGLGKGRDPLTEFAPWSSIHSARSSIGEAA